MTARAAEGSRQVIAGRPTLADDFDYQVPGRHANFATLPDAEYAELYREMWDRFDAFSLNRLR